ncbi:transcriptional regulator, IclR family [Catenulispora acidiphila DSM 44928]|uniref:Transcriptional regulator, IclR family n=1 Tax=Catenulispora acidiphila (strain DSM 44928 / JCM 14897 / NBRC 102108 / NRRL B-24433 / ID139908) TaxID=479433 RepID=C7Q1M4_CATAD|nr:IclR family transcriptional regulator C-terminal domain-containing protein [Catenulispora acidiphila]ACU73753.1 transcriptional regulator, IclR family [Catenulispora acidiphila DSM 44928]
MPQTADAAPVGPLERGLTVLRALALARGDRLRASDLVRATGLARSPVDRLATTLVRLGYLREQDGRDFVLTPKVLEFGLAYLRSSRLPHRLGSLAEALADDLDESVSVAVPDGDAVRFVVQTPRRRALSVTFRAGDALPAERCAPGALFAADWDEQGFERWQARMLADPDNTAFPALPAAQISSRPTMTEFRRLAAEARTNGFALDDQLVEPGLVAVAVPIRDGSGHVVGALSVASHTSRHSAASLRERALEPMLRTARRMTEALATHEDRPAVHRPSRDDSLDPKGELGPEYLQSLARGLSVLAALSVPGGMTLTEVAEATALPRATARRSLLTLESLGYVATDSRRFLPLPRVLELGYPTVSARSLADVAQPHLVDLVHRVHESTSVAVLDGHDIRYIARVAASRIMYVDITVGTRFPAHATSMGRVLVAGLAPGPRSAWLDAADLAPLTAHTVTAPDRLKALLKQTTRDGFALVDQELEEGVRSLAVPLCGSDGRVVAAVNVSLHAGRASLQDVPGLLLPALRETARRITEDIALVFALQPIPSQV